MSLAKYSALARIDLVERITYLWGHVASSFFVGMILFVFLHMWNALYRAGGDVPGYSVPQMIWYLALAEVIVWACGLEWVEKIGEDVRTGGLANSLLRPMDYLASQLVRYAVGFSVTFVLMAAVTSVVAYVLVGPVTVSPLGALASLALILGGALLNFVVMASLGMLSLTLEDSSAFKWMYQKMIFILGGMLVPLDIYPAALRNTISYLPFSLVAYHPARMLIHFSARDFVIALMAQLAWIMVIGTCLLLIYRAGMRRVVIHGG